LARSPRYCRSENFLSRVHLVYGRSGNFGLSNFNTNDCTQKRCIMLETLQTASSTARVVWPILIQTTVYPQMQPGRAEQSTPGPRAGRAG
jgi:hypothetical protein